MTGRYVDEWRPDADWWPDLAKDGSDAKLYELVADVILALIRSGELPADRPVPGVVRIGQRYGVSPGTARKALRLLVDQGWLRRAPDSYGHFVCRKET